MSDNKNYKYWNFQWIKYVLEDVECNSCWRIKVNAGALGKDGWWPNCYWEQCCWRAMFIKTNRYKDAF